MATKRKAAPARRCRFSGCGSVFEGRANRLYCTDRCRGAAFRAKQAERPPLLIRDVETVCATEFEGLLLEALARRVEFGFSRSDIKRMLTRVANLIGTDQPRVAGKFAKRGTLDSC